MKPAALTLDTKHPHSRSPEGQFPRAVYSQIRTLANRPDVSPLRYPGGKRKLAVLIAHILATSERAVGLLVEPFVGGGAVSIALLESGFAHKIALADRDDLVASFWKTVFSPDAERLARKVEDAKVNLKEWDRVATSRPRSDLSRAFKCLYLNRTNFSGILDQRAGPIGGRAQSGPYQLGCRFNQERLAKRIRELSRYSDRVAFVECQDYRKTVAQTRRLVNCGLIDKEELFWYFDPPFFEKADRLYRYVFDKRDHRAFSSVLRRIPGSFVLSYDDVLAAEAIYGNDVRAMAIPFGRTSVSRVYAAAERDLRAARELIVSDLLIDSKTKIAVHNRARAVKAARQLGDSR